MISDELKERILKIKAVIVDIDGVLTDGRIVLGNYGDELKFFDVQDGLGLTLLRRAGFKIMMMSSRKSRINQKRARELRVHKLYQNVHDKLKVFQKVLKRFRLKEEEICFVGDDLVDLPVLSRAGLAIAVPNAVKEVREKAHLVTTKKGGRGAVRELADLILEAQGKWQEVTREYYR